ncbi:energy-coupling factor transporter ATP-binding protein EcfA2 [Cryobacterium sp. MP_M5]|uniref:ATP-binding cassette domain-containing protein n=1 Tax=unclassified Cryobacterium TaxID=2649013 RepID=UPI0018CA392A|nr:MULTISPECIES: ATP-binding cassette domain-containing protein [unclassified Cryobacterium]MBG6058094.1 energy-coupling factor transport system ATP-binding protein [Cryobacterium sp. MP_M3]MEC5176662.1 energy-coupling factor transporter ATP-binding protein EcfA2 [Cryobacterium sp. MP_M5]
MFRFRPAPLRAAAFLAVGFVLLRAGYRVLFAGASGPGLLLLDLPRIPLAGPFSQIALLGPVTAGGLANAALSALPVAALILVFGVLNAVLDVSRLFARGAGRGPLRTVSRALVIAWATFPALLDSVMRVRVAGRLRGGERSIPALLVPVFEQTIERALALAASMETRGFAAAHVVDGACERPVVMTDAALGFDDPQADEPERGPDGQDDWHLADLNLEFAPGTLTVIAGATGSGKSSLLHSLSGLFQHFFEGRQAGRITVGGANRAGTPPRDTAGFVGVVSQNVRLSFVAENVRDEIGFALAVRGVAAVIVDQRVREIAGRLGIGHLLGRPVHALSAGEASLVAIGAALASRPILLLVDEPLADLDAPARVRVCGLLERLAHESGVCVVVAEHNTREWTGAADAWLELRGTRAHRLEAGEVPGTAPAAGPAGLAPAIPAERKHAAPGAPLASIRHLSVRRGSDLVVDDVSLEIASGDVIALEGPNGAGKSSLLAALALPVARGTVFVAGRDVAALRPGDRRAAVALVPEHADDLLFSTTVAEECRRADRAVRRTEAAGDAQPTAARFAGLLGLDLASARHLLRRHPRDLSAGERLCLVIAIQLAAAPSVLLVDEPTRGLDPGARALVGAALLRAGRTASAVVFATHDRDFARTLATRTISMQAGRVANGPLVGAP